MAGFKLNRVGPWKSAAKRMDNAVEKSKKAQILAVKTAALMLEREIKLGIRSGSPGGKKLKPDSPMTVFLKNSTSPLIETGGLMGSVKSTFSSDKSRAFVGVHRTAKSADGKSVVNIALAHEFGTKPFVIPVTARVRAFFFAMHIKSGGAIMPLSSAKTQIMHPGVPARPFIRPSVAKARPKILAKIKKILRDKGGLI